MTLPKGRVVLDAYFGVNLSKDLAGKPITLSPDVWYGVNDDLTVGLVHSGVGTTGFISSIGSFAAGSSLCLSGSSDGCPDLYRNAGLEGRYKLSFGSKDLSLAANGGLFVGSFSDPFLFDLKVGLLGRWHKDKISVEFSPNIFIAVTNRKVADITVNRDFLNIPVTGLYTVMPKLDIAVQLGLALPFEDAGDLYSVPLSIGAHYSVNESLGVTGAFSLPVLVGGDGFGNKGVDARTLVLGGTYAF